MSGILESFPKKQDLFSLCFIYRSRAGVDCESLIGYSQLNKLEKTLVIQISFT